MRFYFTDGLIQGTECHIQFVLQDHILQGFGDVVRDPDVHMGIVMRELWQDLGQTEIAAEDAGAEPDCTFRIFSDIGKNFLKILLFMQYFPAESQHGFTGRCQPEMRLADKENNVVVLFELSNAFAERLLRYKKP